MEPYDEYDEKENKSYYNYFFLDQGDDIFGTHDMFYKYIKEAKRDDEYGYRRTIVEGSSAKTKIIDRNTGKIKDTLLMGSNNYLDFAKDPRVLEAANKALYKHGFGSGSVSLLAGTHQIHKELEKKIASFHGRATALVFPTGYSANVGVISSLVKEGDLLILDMYSHASIVDGTKLCNSTVKFFKHNEMEHLEKLLKRLRNKFKGVLIATDGVFSMDGDVCHFDKLVELKTKYNARLMVDEAHSIGVVGKTGRGTEELFDRVGEADIIVGTLSKAIGGIGGYVTGKKELIEYIQHFATSYVFSTSLPPSIVAGVIEVFNILEKDHGIVKKLQDNADYFSKILRDRGFNLGSTCTAIVPVIIGNEEDTRKIAMELDDKGIFVSAVLFPAVSKTQARLRVSLMATHTKKDLDYALDQITKLGKKYKVI